MRASVGAAAEASLPSRFVARARIGEGGFGVVFDAFDKERRARVAVKTLRAPTPEYLLTLKAEFRIARDLDHPNLVRLGELLESDGRCCFTMEYVEGVSFVEYVRAELDDATLDGSARPAVAFDEPRLRGALRFLVRGLRALHAAGLVHRDVKPSNVLVTKEGRVVVLDFGLAAAAYDESGNAAGGSFAGTTNYVAPEQAAGEGAGPEADFYGVGVMLFEALTGQLPFQGDAHAVLTAKQGPPPAPREVAPQVPEDLDALAVALLDPDPLRRPSGAELARLLGDELGDEDNATSGATFVGRAEERTRLDEALRDAQSRGPVQVVLRGEGGVGKTSLAVHFAEEAQAAVPSLLVLRGRCYEREFVPYKALDGVVDDLVRAFDGASDAERDAWLPGDMRDLVRLFPQLERLRRSEDTPLATLGPAPRREQRTQAFLAFRAMLFALAEQRPLLLILDDMQWADEDSLALLGVAMRAATQPRILVVMTERESPGDRLALEELLPGDLRVVPVLPLPSADAQELARARLAEAGGRESEAAAIAAESQGHPLFLDELVRSSAKGRRAGPLALDAVLRERVEGLDGEAKKLLEVVALAGAPIDQAAAAEAAQVDMSRVLVHLASLRSGRLVRATGSHKPGAVETYHDRVREAVLATLTPSQRPRLHRRIATILARHDPDDPQIVATHWLAAKRPDRAAEYALRAAERASRALAFDRAARMYRLALELEGNGPRVVELRRHLVDALSHAGREAEAADERLVLATALAPHDALEQRRRAAEQLLRSGHHERGLALLLELLAVAGLPYPRSPLFVVLRLLWVRLLLSWKPLPHTLHFDARDDDAHALRVDIACSAASGFSMTDNVRGAYFQAVALREALAVGEPERLIHALCMDICFRATGAHRVVADIDARLAHLDGLAAQAPTGPVRAMVEVAHGFAAFFRGDWAKAAAKLASAERVFVRETVGLVYELNGARTVHFRALALLGRMDELRTRGEAAFRDAVLRGDLQSQVSFRCTSLVPVALARGALDEAREEERAAAVALPPGRFLLPHFYHLMARVDVFLYGQDPEAALASLERAAHPLRRSLLPRILTVRVLYNDLRARALLTDLARVGPAMPEGRAAVARSLRVCRRLERENSAWAKGLARLHRATLAALRGDTTTAAEGYTAASLALAAQGLGVHAAVASLRAAELTGRSDAATFACDELRRRGVSRPELYAGLLAPARNPRASAPAL